MALTTDVMIPFDAIMKKNVDTHFLRNGKNLRLRKNRYHRTPLPVPMGAVRAVQRYCTHATGTTTPERMVTAVANAPPLLTDKTGLEVVCVIISYFR